MGSTGTGTNLPPSSRPERDSESRSKAGSTPVAPPASIDQRVDAVWKRAYAAKSREDLTQLYADWAETYDEDHAHIGFNGHRIAAEVLARHTTRHDVARVLDAGAGTGAAGEALHELGFRDLTALDLSPEMIEVARRKGVYNDAHVVDLSLPVDQWAPQSFDAVILVGVFSYGQAPAEALDEIIRLTRPGGVVVLTMRTDFFEEDAMGLRSKLRTLERSGVWNLLERTEPAPYLPGKDPDAMFRVWCYRVTGTLKDEVEDGFEDAVREAFESDEYVVTLDHSWIWDSTASRLYNRYTRSDGYYLTDCEEEILRDRADEIVGEERTLVELGCGSARKVRHLLEAATRSVPDVHYMPIDVSEGALRATVAEVQKAFGERVRIHSRQGLFQDVLSEIPADERKLLFFFGSSLGNLESIEATVEFLTDLRSRLTPGDRFVVGLDLHKDEDVLERAYDEEEDCRAFFVHMVRRINDYLGAHFDPRVFELSSTYEQEQPWKGVAAHRMNLRVAPRVPQRTYVQKLDLEVSLEAGQPIQVGISRKYGPEAIRRLAELAGFRLERQWFDRRRWFSLNEFVPAD